jgi:cytochrome oxidase Cu insertion factor (SCO1/SenC/PrrC family)
MAHETPPGELTEEQRRQAFRAELAASSSSGGQSRRPTIPAKAVWLVIATFAVLGLGGAVLEHFVGNLGGVSVVSTTLPLSAPTTTRPLPPAVLNMEYIGLKQIGTQTAPPVTLLDQSGLPWRLADARGRILLIAFFDQDCQDICPVLGAELRDALALLAAQKVNVDVAIVNADPQESAYRADPAALSTPGLANRSNVQFLTGPLRALDSVWTEYGISVKVGARFGEVSHNDVLYFVDARGYLRALARPFAQQINATTYALSPSDIERFARGVATEAVSLSR